MGPSGDTSGMVDTRSFSEEKGSIKGGYNMQANQLRKYVAGSPVQSAAQGGVLDFWNAYQPLVGTGPGSAAASGYNAIAPTIASGGKLSAEGLRSADQDALAMAAQAGMATGTQGIASRLLNREKYTDARLNTALGQAENFQQLQAGELGIETGYLNSLLGVQNASVGQFSQLNNPILAYLGNLFGGNQQASIAQAQIASGAQQAGDAKTMKAVEMGVEGAGNILGAAVGSDERIKTKIRDTGIKTDDGVPWKIWEYATRPGVEFLGHTAQDVEKSDPGWVATDPVSGIKSVGFKYFPVQLTQEAA